MKKYIAAILIVLAIITGYFIFKRPAVITNKDGKVQKTVQLVSELPNGWFEVESKEAQVKLEKKVEKGLKPQIVLVKTNSKDAQKAAEYIDRIKAGARSTITKLSFSNDKRIKEGTTYVALLSGQYYNNKTQISLIQRIYIKGEEVNTLTASYSGDMAKEVNEILDMIVKEKIEK